MANDSSTTPTDIDKEGKNHEDNINKKSKHNGVCGNRRVRLAAALVSADMNHDRAKLFGEIRKAIFERNARDA